MDRWVQIEKNRYRLLCSGDSCSLSLANLLNGKIHITTIHGSHRHSYTFDDYDMQFIILQYLSSLDDEKREKIVNCITPTT